MRQKHRGLGGVYFIVASVLCAFMMTTVLRLSYDSQCISLADNMAKICTMNVTTMEYLNRTSSYTNQHNPSISISSYSAFGEPDDTYNPISDYNNMLNSMGISSEDCSDVYITWNAAKKTATVQFGAFKNNLGSEIKAHQQTYLVENM